MNSKAESSKKQTIAEDNIQGTTRRKALKSLLATSGVVAGSQALSSQWSKPLIEAVILPAHAQTSGTSGTFTSGIINNPISSNRNWFRNSNLLDTLISPAHANHDDVAESVCGEEETGGGSYQLLFNIQGSTVDICFSSLGGHQECTKEGFTTIDGNNIADITFVVDASVDDIEDQEVVIFTQMVVNDEGNQVNGQMEIASNPAGEAEVNLNCVNEFTADLIPGAYACNEACTDEGGG